jgi:hypothetical protein
LLASIAEEEDAIMKRLDRERQASGRARRSPRPIPIDRKSRRQAEAELCDRGASGAPEGAGAHGDPDDFDELSSWRAAAATLVSAAVTIRLQAELDWLELVRETLHRMSVEHHTAVGLAGTHGAPAIQ